MTRKLNKKVWPFLFIAKHKVDTDGWLIDDKDEDIKIRQEWLINNLNNNIRNRVYIIEDSRGVCYYFKHEEDYTWFLWRWS